MLNIAQLINNITSSKNLSTTELLQLQEIMHQYPFFQIGYAILLKKSNSITESEYKKATIYATDKNYLHFLLEEKFPFNDCSNSRYKKNIGSTNLNANDDLNKSETYNNLNSSSKIFHSKNDQVLEEILQKKKKEYFSSKISSQKAIIDSFLSKKISWNQDLQNISSKGETDNEDLANSELKIDEDILTENLFKIYINQGKTEKALDIYEKLVTKYPEKIYIFKNMMLNNND